MSYTFTPKRNIKTAGALSLTLFVLSVTLFAFANLLFTDSKALLQLFGTLSATGAIFILVKFIIISYVYEIDGDDLSVIEISGKKRTTVARVSVSSITELAEKPKKGEKVYNFCLELFPARTLTLVIEDGDGRYNVLLSYVEEMENMIKDKKSRG